MQEKTVETTIDLLDIYDRVKTKLEARCDIDQENSRCSESHFVLVGVKFKGNSMIIRASIDKSLNRSYFSTIAIPTEAVIKEDTRKLTIRDVGLKILDYVLGQGDMSNPFMELTIQGMKHLIKRFSLNKDEKTMMNDIAAILARLGYYDDLFEHPFPVCDIDGDWECWNRVYQRYLLSIENRLRADTDIKTRSYRDYDFASASEEVQRIFDLVAIGEVNKPLVNLNKMFRHPTGAIDEKARKVILLTFVYAHKKITSINEKELMDLAEHVGLFAKDFQKKHEEEYRVVNPQLVVVSLYGFTGGVGPYLQKNLFREVHGMIPVFVIPPLADGTWHNFMADINNGASKLEIDEGLTEEDIESAEESSIENIGTKIRQKAETIFDGIKSTVKFANFSQKERVLRADFKLLKKWSDILQIPLVEEVLSLEASRDFISSTVEKYNQESIESRDE